jgi:hypothetical protein
MSHSLVLWSSKLAQAAMLQICIWEIPGLNPSQDTDYPDWSISWDHLIPSCRIMGWHFKFSDISTFFLIQHSTDMLSFDAIQPETLIQPLNKPQKKSFEAVLFLLQYKDLTPWRRVLDKVTVVWLANKLLTLYGPQRFILSLSNPVYLSQINSIYILNPPFLWNRSYPPIHTKSPQWSPFKFHACEQYISETAFDELFHKNLSLIIYMRSLHKALKLNVKEGGHVYEPKTT